MASNDWMQAALQHYRDERERILGQLSPESLMQFRSLELMIRKLEEDLGQSPVVFAEPPYSTAAPVSVPGLGASKPLGKSVEIRADEFFAMTISDAARAYLSRVGHAVSLDELIEKLRAGGCRVGGANPKHTLYISLVRNTRDFVPTGNGFIGLRSFYPGLKAGAAKADKPKKAKGKHKVKPKRMAGKVAGKASKLLAKKQPKLATVTPDEPPAHKVVYAILKDGELHPKEAILKAGEDAGIMPIAIHGILRSKEIEAVGDSYRLKRESKGEDVKVG